MTDFVEPVSLDVTKTGSVGPTLALREHYDYMTNVRMSFFFGTRYAMKYLNQTCVMEINFYCVIIVTAIVCV